MKRMLMFLVLAFLCGGILEAQIVTQPVTIAMGSPDTVITMTALLGPTNTFAVWNGSELLKTTQTGGNLSVVVPKADLVAAGTSTLFLMQQGQNQTVTQTVTITINAASTPPTITNVLPGHSIAGQSSLVVVTGTGFTNGSQVQVNGTAVATTFTSATSLSATLPATLVAGTANITVTGANGTSGQKTFNVVAPLVVTTTALAAGQVGVAYTASLSASGGTIPYTWSVSAGLPAGLTLNSTTGVISGTPSTAVASASFTVTVVDSTGALARLTVKGKKK